MGEVDLTDPDEGVVEVVDQSPVDAVALEEGW